MAAILCRRILGIAVGLLLIPLSAVGACRLPVPDGGGDDYVPSPENIFGDIVRVKLPVVTIRNGKTHTLEQVSVAKTPEFYTVYGGDGSRSALKPGLQVWVWFKDCKRPAKGIPMAAYFQVFSTSPEDRAVLDPQGRIVSVPGN